MAQNPKLQETLGYIVPNLVGVAIIAADKYWISNNFNNFPGTLVFSEFIIIPMLIGIMSAWFWRRLDFSGRKVVGNTIINTFIAVLFSAAFLNEGSICLLIVSPLLFGFMIAGVSVGRIMFRRNNNNINFSIVTLLIAIFITDSVSKHFYENEVSDTIVINAPPAKVWKNVVAFKRIQEPNKFWLFRIGMPSPVESTVDGYYLGARRKCIFSNGYTFDEKIVTYNENENLTFAVTHQPRDPEIMGHIDILQGQFLLKDNGNGTTTLTGNSWYKLYVFPVWYYDIWAQSITRNVHLRVMAHIKELSEAK
jgi:hypothetical protein